MIQRSLRFSRHTSDGRMQTLHAHLMGVKRASAEFGKKIGLEALCALAALLHDGGEATMEWQEYLRNDDKHSKKRNHSSQGARWLDEHFIIDNSGSGKIAKEILCWAICNHHSGPGDMVDIEGNDSLGKRMRPEDDVHYEEAVKGILEEIGDIDLNSLFYKACGEMKTLIKNICEVFPDQPVIRQRKFAVGLTARIVLSCLIDADRLDAYLFEADLEYEPYEPPEWSLLYKNMMDRYSEFKEDSPLNAIRRQLSDECAAFQTGSNGIYQLMIPTGGGKTLASLRAAIQACMRYKKDRLFYFAPYNSILSQNAKEVQKALKDLSIILEHYGDAITNEEDNLLVERWDAPVVLSSMVQFLNTLFSSKSSCVRRFHQLENSVIILDEIQSLPTRCTHMVNAALNFLAKMCNCIIILCTATQPLLDKVEQPILFGDPASMIANVDELFAALKRTKLIDKTQNTMTVDELADFTIERMQEEKTVLTVLNSRESVWQVCRAVQDKQAMLGKEERAEIVYLTNNLCPAHKKEVIEKLKELMKDKNARVICMSTSIIEAGVDFDFGTAIRSLAGMTNAAQTAGRCNRNGKRPMGLVYLVRLEGEKLPEDTQRDRLAAERTLEDYRRAPGQFHDDLLSPAAIERYYRYDYEQHREEMDYPVKDSQMPTGTNLFDLLSSNSPAMRVFDYEEEKEGRKRALKQAFGTAGKRFRAIEENGQDIIVPYKDGKELINQILCAKDIKEKKRLLRQAQPYTVHLYQGMVKKLEDAVISAEDIAYLDERYYSEEYGVTLHAGKYDLLMV